VKYGDMFLRSKMNTCDTNVELLVHLSVAVYGSETWTLGKNEQRVVKYGAGEEC
jgi:hypothetical protein